jgi:hypothetical protein
MMRIAGTHDYFSRLDDFEPHFSPVVQIMMRPGDLREAGIPSPLPCPFGFPASWKSFRSAEFSGGWRMANGADCIRFFARSLRAIASTWTSNIDSVIPSFRPVLQGGKLSSCRNY